MNRVQLFTILHTTAYEQRNYSRSAYMQGSVASTTDHPPRMLQHVLIFTGLVYLGPGKRTLNFIMRELNLDYE